MLDGYRDKVVLVLKLLICTDCCFKMSRVAKKILFYSIYVTLN